MKVSGLQAILGVKPDGQFGPITTKAFIDAFVNKNAQAINDYDYEQATKRLECSMAQIKAFAAIESGGSSFSINGRPKILFEAHYFSRLTNGKYNRSHPSISSRRWSRNLYSRYMVGRYMRLARAAALDVNAALSSASWGKFQIMGSHWKHLGYKSPWDFVQKMVQSEKNHLDAFVRYIEKNGLADELRQAKANDPRSCIPIVRRYNGPAYAKNNYHVRLAKMIAKFS